MQREQRLRKPAEFTAVHRRGRGHASNLLSVRTLPNGLTVSRFGFVVSKRVGNAVTRNRVKRRLRAAASLAEVAPGFDVVVIARPGARLSRYAQLQDSLLALLRRSSLLAASRVQAPLVDRSGLGA